MLIDQKGHVVVDDGELHQALATFTGAHLLGRIGNAIDEGGVGAVLQQAADEMAQQRFVRADGSMDAAEPIELRSAHHLLIEPLAHAVQALELVPADFEVGPAM